MTKSHFMHTNIVHFPLQSILQEMEYVLRRSKVRKQRRQAVSNLENQIEEEKQAALKEQAKAEENARLRRRHKGKDRCYVKLYW